ncbi:helix-turn-helix domain-containing protein [Flavobacteriaceae bacterium GSB9]|nr:helix-turn-helix domain-containing protein [Flavobacteriaceae bacterium GSB9]
MSESNLAKRVKELRRRKGLSQEDLAENSGLSLRTIQRIENNETVPRGDTLKKMSQALNCTHEDIVDWKVQEDKGYLTLMSLSALGFLFFPLLGVIIPLTLWILKKERVKGVNRLGKSILNFQITWALLLFSFYICFITGMLGGFLGKLLTFISPSPWLSIIIVLGTLYGYNIVITVINTLRIHKEKSVFFKPALPILR